MGESPGAGREISQRNYDVVVTKPSRATNFSVCPITCGYQPQNAGIPREAKGKPHAIHRDKGRSSALDGLGPRGLQRLKGAECGPYNVAVDVGNGNVAVGVGPGDVAVGEHAHRDFRGSQ